MYEEFFGFSDRPFLATPDVQRFFPTASIQLARETALRCIRRAEGTAIIIGPVGTGKTILCQSIAQELSDEFQIAMLSSGRLCTRRALLQGVLYELGLPYRQMDEGELRLALQHHLDSRETTPRDLLLIVDEADTLPIRLIEELRVLANSTQATRQPTALLLAGGCRLEERLASPKLETFGQRITARCYLDSMNREETAEYMRGQLSHVGASLESLFTPDACRAVHHATDGIARLVNQLCDHALVLAFAANRPILETADVDEAWADLQQLPAPVVAARGSQGQDHGEEMVEFGSLDDNTSVEFGALDEDTNSIAPNSIAPSSDNQTASVPFPVVRDEMADEDVVDEDVANEDKSDEFQPSGTIGPEVELMIDDDPFGESFQSEEVLIDRYASLDRELLDKKPRVASRLGRELSASLTGCSIEEVRPGEPVEDEPFTTPWPSGEEQQIPSQQESVQAKESEQVQETAADEEAGPDDAHESFFQAAVDDLTLVNQIASADFETQPFGFDPASPAADPIMPEPVASGTSPGSLDITIPVVVSPVDDPVYPEDDLIVIEDDEPTGQSPQDTAVGETPAPPTKPRVRRQQYRQLFANLQRGSG